MTDISEAVAEFEDGVDDKAAEEWRRETEDSADEYRDEFEGVLSEQNDCAEATAHLDGRERLVAYAECVKEADE